MRSCNFLANWVANHITRSANDFCQVVHSSNSYCIVIVIVENDNFSFGLEVEKMPMTIKQPGGEKTVCKPNLSACLAFVHMLANDSIPIVNTTQVLWPPLRKPSKCLLMIQSPLSRWQHHNHWQQQGWHFLEVEHNFSEFIKGLFWGRV